MSKRTTMRDVSIVVAVLLVMTVVYFLAQSSVVRDIWLGWGYEPTEQILGIEEDLELTDKGRRIFRATRPTVEQSEAFNSHCENHDAEISVIGCYAGGQIYIYEIKTEELVEANKVTAAHELLHAAWERMGEGERARIAGLLDDVYAQNSEWMEEELAAYQADVRTEEMYTRAGTKLAELPAELEQHYGEYFRNRARIVEFYRSYEAPFERLKGEMEELEKQIIAEKAVIARERDEYLRALDALNTKIDSFNACADTQGCFTSEAEFNQKRQALGAEQTGLEEQRETLNRKIDENNARIAEYEEVQLALGELSDSMNSNISKDETEK